MLHCQKYKKERRGLIQNLKIHFDLIDNLQKNSRNECYWIVFHYLKLTMMIEKIRASTIWKLLLSINLSFIFQINRLLDNR